MAARKRSVVWSFFQDDLILKSAECLLCAESIQHCGNTTNMLKHLRSKHQGALTNAARRRRFGDVTRGPVRQVESKQALRADDTAENGAEISEMEDQQTEPSEGNEDMGRAINDSINGAQTLKVTKSRKRSAVWRYFQDGFDPNRVLCLVCSENIHYPQNTSNLLRHLRKKHPSEYSDIEGCLKERSGEKAAAMVTSSLAERALHNGVPDDQVIRVSITSDGFEEHERISNEDTSRTVSDIVSEAFSLSVLPTKRRSAVWRYYEQHGEDANKVLCLLCSEYIHYRQNTSNLLRHLRKKHPEKNLDQKNRGASLEGVEQGRHAFPDDYRNTGAPPGLMAPITLESPELDRRALDPSGQMRRTLEQTEQMRRTLEQETRALERERELTEQLRRAQQQEARALEQQRELTEQLRRAQEEEMRRTRELEARALEQERHAVEQERHAVVQERHVVEQLRKTQEQEARAIEREREALEQLRKELEEDRKSLQRHWDAIRQGRVTVATAGGEDCAIPRVVEAGEVEMLVVTT